MLDEVGLGLAVVLDGEDDRVVTGHKGKLVDGLNHFLGERDGWEVPSPVDLDYRRTGFNYLVIFRFLKANCISMAHFGN